MNFRILLVFFVFVTNVAMSQELIIEGVFRGANVYVMNPFTKTEHTFSIESIFVNDKEYSEDIESSAFEIDLKQMGFKLGEDLRFCIKYKDSVMPSIINMEAIQAISSFEMKKSYVDKNQFLNWKCSEEVGSLPFLIEQYRWDKWIRVGRLRGIGTSGENHYKIKVPVHSGINLFRVYQKDYTDKKRFSDTIQYKSNLRPVSIVNKKVISKLRFSAPTQFEIFDIFGNMIYDGFGKEVFFDDLIPGKYYVNYDNSMTEFIKQ